MIEIQSSEVKFSHTWSNDFWIRVPRLFNEEKIVFSTNGVGELGIHMQNNKPDSYSTLTQTDQSHKGKT